MKDLLYAPLLIATPLTLYKLASRVKPIRCMWHPMVPLVLCLMMASSLRNGWWVFALGGIAAFFSLYSFYRLFGFASVALASIVALVVSVLLPEYHTSMEYSFGVSFVVAGIADINATRKYTRGETDEEFWK